MSCFDIEGWRRSRRQPRQYYDLQNPFPQALAKSTPSPVRSEQEGAPTLPENCLDLLLRASSWISLTTLFAPMEKWGPSSTPPYTTLPILTKPEDFGLVVSSVLTHFSRLLIILIDGQKKSNKFMAEKIPRRIIQMWGGSDLPLLAKAAATNLRLLNPNFEYLFFDDAQIEKFIDSKFPQYRPVFNSFTARIQRYDFFRYLAVYRFGGFYFDTDVLLASGLEDLLEFGCVFPFEHLSIYSFLREEYGMDWEAGNYAFGAAVGHPFLEAIIKNCVRAQQHPEWPEAMLKSIPRMFRSEYSVLATTGPGLVSRTLAEYPGACDQVKVLFPKDVCDQNSWFRFGDYGVHLQVGTWRKRERLLRRLLHRRWVSTTRKALFSESLKRGGKRSLEFKSSTAQRQEASRLSNALG